MKKFCSFFLILLVSAQIFAEENWTGNYNIGLGIPFFNLSFESTNSVDVDANGNGVNFSFTAQAINKTNGFLIEAGLGIGELKVKNFYNADDEWGFNFQGQLGLGYAFKHDSHGIVTLAGIIGYDWSFFEKDVSVSLYGSSYRVTVEAMPWVFYIGCELSGTARLSEKVGVFGNCLFAVPFAGWEVLKVSYSGFSSSSSYDLNSGGYFIQPSFGLSITVD